MAVGRFGWDIALQICKFDSFDIKKPFPAAIRLHVTPTKPKRKPDHQPSTTINRQEERKPWRERIFAICS
jgi:hypothetical protein